MDKIKTSILVSDSLYNKIKIKLQSYGEPQLDHLGISYHYSKLVKGDKSITTTLWLINPKENIIEATKGSKLIITDYDEVKADSECVIKKIKDESELESILINELIKELNIKRE